jgi:manganese transport protein
MGQVGSVVFLVSLLVAGLSSSVVGTMAGQTIMQGFVEFSIPVWLRRLITMAPPIVIIALGVDATRALVLSQVVLSLTLPVPLVALVLLTSRSTVMGSLESGGGVKALAWGCSALIVALNLLYLASVVGVGPLQS